MWHNLNVNVCMHALEQVCAFRQMCSRTTADLLICFFQRNSLPQQGNVLHNARESTAEFIYFFLTKGSVYTLIAEVGTEMFLLGLELFMVFYVTESLLERHHLGS